MFNESYSSMARETSDPLMTSTPGLARVPRIRVAILRRWSRYADSSTYTTSAMTNSVVIKTISPAAARSRSCPTLSAFGGSSSVR